MQATKFHEFGPGDSATWPPFAGHPHDPRAPIDDDDPTIDVISDVRSFLAIAEVAAKKGDLGKGPPGTHRGARLSLEELVGGES
jgi:hypothetical protein